VSSSEVFAGGLARHIPLSGRIQAGLLRKRLPAATKRQGRSAALVMPMRGPGFAGKNIEPVRVAAEIEGARQFSRSGTEGFEFCGGATAFHRFDSAGGFQCADEHKAVLGAAFHQKVQKPMDAVVEINVGGAGGLLGHEGARGRSGEGVAGLVVQDRVGLGLDDDPAAVVPDELAPDKFAGANKGLPLEKLAADFFHVQKTTEKRSPVTSALERVEAAPGWMMYWTSGCTMHQGVSTHW